jgi:hypothetical protein
VRLEGLGQLKSPLSGAEWQDMGEGRRTPENRRNVALYKYLGITTTNYDPDETKFWKFKSPCISEHLSFHHLPENIKIKIYKTIIFPIILYPEDETVICL